MKKKFKRYGKRTVSVLLSLMIVISCMILGQIAPLEAEALSYSDVKSVYFKSGFTSWNADSSTILTKDSTNPNKYSGTFYAATGDYTGNNGACIYIVDNSNDEYWYKSGNTTHITGGNNQGQSLYRDGANNININTSSWSDNYMKVDVVFYVNKDDSTSNQNEGWFNVSFSAVNPTLSTTLQVNGSTTAPTDVKTGATITVGSTNASGGTGTYSHVYSYVYTPEGGTQQAATTITGDSFTPTAAGSYTVTDTMTDSNLSDLTAATSSLTFNVESGVELTLVAGTYTTLNSNDETADSQTGGASITGGSVTIPHSGNTVTVTPNSYYSVRSVTYTYVNSSSATVTKDAVLTSTTSTGALTVYSYSIPTYSDMNNETTATVNVTFGPIRTFRVLAYIDDTNKPSKYAADTTSTNYVTLLSSGGEEVETSGIVKYVDITEGESVTLTINDTANSTDWIIDKWAISGTYSLSSGTTLEAERGTDSTSLSEHTITITPKSNITAVGYFKEDRGVAQSGLYVLNSANGANQNPSNLTYPNQVYKTFADNYYAYITNGVNGFNFEANGKYYIGLASGTSPSADTVYKADDIWIRADSGFSPYVDQASTSQYYWSAANGESYKVGQIKLKNVIVHEIKIEVYVTAKETDSPKTNITSAAGNKIHYRLSADIKEVIDQPLNKTSLVIAKDGTLRGSYNKYASMADTKITHVKFSGASNYTQIDSDDNSFTNNGTKYALNDKAFDGLAETVKLPVGTTVRFQTNITSNQNNYYVKAFNVNGETVFPTGQNLDSNGLSSDNIYIGEYTIQESDASKYVEITPIYYYKDAITNPNDYITFHVENFDDAAKGKWGNDNANAILAVYAWYNTDQGNDVAAADAKNKPALGGYPGQPMVYVNGSYEMQVPKTLNNSSVLGVTMNNYVWDYVHSYTMIGSNASDSAREGVNAQTYDYDDFVALSTLITNDPNTYSNDIIFRFKYEDASDPATTSSSYSNRWFGNTPSVGTALSSVKIDYDKDWETYTDYNGNVIDLFNNILDKESTSPYKILSDGYQDMYYGHFGVMWYIYKNDGTYVGRVPSSAFFYDVAKTTDKNVTFDATGNITSTNIPSDFITTANGSSLDTRRTEYWTTYKTLYNSARGTSAVIKYETAIKAQDANGNGHPKDPGLRNDGRWYASKKVKINANIIIEYKETSASNTYKEDKYSTALNGDEINSTVLASTTNPIGKITGATPKFTNVAKYSNMVVAKDVNADPNSSFTFAVPSTTSSGVLSSDTTKAQTYLFEGWYIKKDGVYSKINPTDTAKLTGETSMIGETTLVARYTPMSGDVLTITHDLYKDATKYENSPHAYGGSGTTYVTIDIVDNEGNSVSSITTTPNSNSSVSIDKTVLSEYTVESYQDYMLKVTLTSVPDEGSEFKTLYRKTQSENGSVANYETYTSDMQKVGYVAFSSDTTTITNSDAYDVNSWNSDRSEIAANDASNTVIYTCPISNLLTSGESPALKTNIVRFYTDIVETATTNRKVDVHFKYYDRDDSETAQGMEEDVDSTPTTVSVQESIDLGKDSKFELKHLTNAVAAAYDDKPTNSITPVSSISSVLDKYIFWTTQTAALDGIKGLTNHHNNESTYGNSSLKDGDLAYHTNQYGYVNGETFNDSTVENTEKWVSYYDVNDRLIDKNESEIDPDLVYTVVVWGFNTPKQYNAKFNCATMETDLTPIGDSDMYKANNITQAGDLYYYNERVGITYGGSYDEISPYLKNVFSQNGYSGRLNSSKNSKNNVTESEITSSNENCRYVFDGWYDANGIKVSTDYNYQNRITAKLELTAYYKKVTKNETVTTDKGFTINQNQTERFIAEDGDEYVRLVMMVNGYGYDDGDTNIQKIGLVQIVLPGTVASDSEYVSLINDETLKTSFTTLLDGSIGIEIKTAVADDDNVGKSVMVGRVALNGTDNITYNCAVRVYVFNALVTVVEGEGKDAAQEAIKNADKSKTVIFTNKNRTQMTMIFNEDLVEPGANRSDLVYFAAIGYENGTTSGIDSGEVLFTDGYVRFTNGTGNAELTGTEPPTSND